MACLHFVFCCRLDPQCPQRYNADGTEIVYTPWLSSSIRLSRSEALRAKLRRGYSESAVRSGFRACQRELHGIDPHCRLHAKQRGFGTRQPGPGGLQCEQALQAF